LSENVIVGLINRRNGCSSTVAFKKIDPWFESKIQRWPLHGWIFEFPEYNVYPIFGRYV